MPVITHQLSDKMVRQQLWAVKLTQIRQVWDHFSHLFLHWTFQFTQLSLPSKVWKQCIQSLQYLKRKLKRYFEQFSDQNTGDISVWKNPLVVNVYCMCLHLVYTSVKFTISFLFFSFPISPHLLGKYNCFFHLKWKYICVYEINV